MARLQHIITPPPTSFQGIPRGKNKGEGNQDKSKGGVILAKKEKGLGSSGEKKKQEEEKEEGRRELE